MQNLTNRAVCLQPLGLGCGKQGKTKPNGVFLPLAWSDGGIQLISIYHPYTIYHMLYVVMLELGLRNTGVPHELTSSVQGYPLV